MSYIGSKPANKPVVASDLDPTIITGQTALGVAPADTDEFLISDAGVLKRLDASLIGGGKLLQFLNTSWTTTTTSTSSTYADVSGGTLSITPSLTSSKIYVTGDLHGIRKDSNTYMGIKLLGQIDGGGYSELDKIENGFLHNNATDIVSASCRFSFYHTSNTTTQVDYKIQINSGTNISSVTVNNDAQEQSTITLMEIGA